jgi:hypothetical protein
MAPGSLFTLDSKYHGKSKFGFNDKQKSKPQKRLTMIITKSKKDAKMLLGDRKNERETRLREGCVG